MNYLIHTGASDNPVGQLDLATQLVYEMLEGELEHDLFCPVHGELAPEGHFLYEEEEEEY